MNKVSALLKSSYLKKKKENPRFSMQMIAKRLGISLPFTSQVLNGKRNLTPELVEGFCSILDLDSEQRDFVSREVLLSKKLKGTAAVLNHLTDQKAQKWESKEVWVPGEKNLFWLLSDWRYLALFSAFHLKDYDGTTAWLSQRMGFTEEFVMEATLKMKEAGVIREGPNGKLVQSNKLYAFKSEQRKDELRVHHTQCLDNAKRVINDKPTAADAEKRYITTYITSASKMKVEWARREIADFMRHLAEELNSSPGEEVYQLSVQLIPLTETDSES